MNQEGAPRSAARLAHARVSDLTEPLEWAQSRSEPPSTAHGHWGRAPVPWPTALAQRGCPEAEERKPPPALCGGFGSVVVGMASAACDRRTIISDRDRYGGSIHAPNACGHAQGRCPEDH